MKTYISEINGRWYAFAGCEETNQVYSIGNDCPPAETGCSAYCAEWCNVGIMYVASPLITRSGAIRKAKRCGDYIKR